MIYSRNHSYTYKILLPGFGRFGFELAKTVPPLFVGERTKTGKSLQAYSGQKPKFVPMIIETLHSYAADFFKE